MDRPPVGIIGIGFVPFRVNSGSTFLEMVYESVQAALADAGIAGEDVDTIVDAGIDLLDGKGISNADLLGAAHGYLKEEVKVEEDGAIAAYYAYHRLRAGTHRTALVFGYSRSTAVPLEQYSAVMFHPVLQRPLGVTQNVALALQAQAYLGHHGEFTPARHRLLERSGQAARRNPILHDMPLRSMQDSDEVICDPLRRGDLPVNADGAMAVVLSVRPRRDGGTAWIRGVGLDVDSPDLGDRDPAVLSSLSRAAKAAYARAEIRRPADEIDVFEVAEPSTVHLLMMLEALGLTQPGGAAQWVDSAGNEAERRVNPSGGNLSAQCLVAAGLWRLVEGVKAVRQGARMALAHGAGGIGMQSHSVFLLSS